jgi:hypothetical protein
MLPQAISNPTPGNADLLLVGDNAADRLGITKVAVGNDVADTARNCESERSWRHHADRTPLTAVLKF